MTLTNFQKELVNEIQRVSINTRYPGNMTLSMNEFLKEIVALRNKADKNCGCRRCKYMTMFR